jgi:hypothetical protein
MQSLPKITGEKRRQTHPCRRLLTSVEPAADSGVALVQPYPRPMTGAAHAYTVFAPKPLSMPYAEAMRRLRTWLDCKKLETTSFEITTDGRIGFEVGFSSERDAAEFQLFNWEK